MIPPYMVQKLYCERYKVCWKKGGKTNLSMFLSVCQINAFVIFATGILNSIHQIDQKKILGGSYLKVGIFVHASKCKQYWKCTKSRRRGKSYATRNNHCNSTGKKWRKCNFSRKLFPWGTQKLNVREGVHVKVLLAAVFYYIGNMMLLHNDGSNISDDNARWMGMRKLITNFVRRQKVSSIKVDQHRSQGKNSFSTSVDMDVPRHVLLDLYVL